MLSQPEDVLSHNQTPGDTHSLNHIFPLFDDTVHNDFLRVVQQGLTRNLPITEDELLEELQIVLDEKLGHVDDESWTEVQIVDVLENIMFRVCMRMFMGLPHCRDAECRYYTKQIVRLLGVASIVTSQIMPWPIRPFFGILLGLPVYYSLIRLGLRMEPVFRERLVNLQRQKADPNNGYKKPTNLISWITESAINDPVAKYVTPWQIFFRYCIVVSAHSRETLVVTV